MEWSSYVVMSVNTLNQVSILSVKLFFYRMLNSACGQFIQSFHLLFKKNYSVQSNKDIIHSEP